MCNTLVLPCFIIIPFIFVALAVEEVATFYCEINDEDINSGTSNTVEIYLWYNFTIYLYTMDAPQHGDMFTGSKFSNPPLQVYGSSDCPKLADNSVVEAKVMIVNDDPNAVMIDKIGFQLTSGEWFGIDSFYHADGGVGNIICVDNEFDNCGPSKQISYFDLSHEGTYIDGALWGDGTNVRPDRITCDPTPFPTASPTPSPTSSPTSSSTPSLTASPTCDPTPFPTASPTSSPTPAPTTSPTIDPTTNPTTSPSAFPTVYPSMYPSQQSTDNHTMIQVLIGVWDNPTVAPTFIPIIASTKQELIASDADIAHKKTHFFDILHSSAYSLQIYAIIAAATVVVCIAFVTLLVCVYRKRKRKRKRRNLQLDRIRLTTVDPEHYQHYSEVAISAITSREARLIQKWLQIKVVLPQYLYNFIENGYNDINRILYIKNEDTLNAMGITDPTHCIVLMREIKKLRTIARHNKRKQHRHCSQEQQLCVQHSVNKVISSQFEVARTVIVHDECEGDTDEFDEEYDDILQGLEEFITNTGEYDEGLQNDGVVAEDGELIEKVQRQLELGEKQQSPTHYKKVSNITIDAMKQDKIVLGIISTKRNEINMDEPMGQSTDAAITIDAMKNDKIVSGIVSMKKDETNIETIQTNRNVSEFVQEHGVTFFPI